MKGGIFYIILFSFFSVLLAVLCSCSSNADALPVAPDKVDITMSFDVAIPASGGEELSRGISYGSDDGSLYDRYVDIARDNYRIYFFSATDNTFITRFTTQDIVAENVKDFRYYNFNGRVPDALVDCTNPDAPCLKPFKIVVLANYTQAYRDDLLVPGVTTIDQLRNADWTTYNGLTNFQLSPNDKRLIPFFGVHEYSSVPVADRKVVKLSDPVVLIRAMAKVWVYLNASDATISSCRIVRRNTRGYCIPNAVNSHTDYNTPTQNIDYSAMFNPLTSYNGNALDMYLASTKDAICYVPEYANVGDTSSDCYLVVQFSFTDPSDDSYRIYFTEYKSDGMTPDFTKPISLYRNCNYNFRVTIVKGKIKIEVNNWENAFNLPFEF